MGYRTAISHGEKELSKFQDGLSSKTSIRYRMREKFHNEPMNGCNWPRAVDHSNAQLKSTDTRSQTT
jgi:hypothetical protein